MSNLNLGICSQLCPVTPCNVNFGGAWQGGKRLAFGGAGQPVIPRDGVGRASLVIVVSMITSGVGVSTGLLGGSKRCTRQRTT